MNHKIGMRLATLAALAGALPAAMAADWSDTSIGIRYGTKFQEPFNGQDISKTIVNITHASGDKYGSNFFNVDLLNSDATDNDAQEAYVVYRRSFDYSKLSGQKFSWGPLRDWGVTTGFDWNTKNDPGYGSRKRMLVLGPTAMFNVPGFLNASVLALFESNQPAAAHIARYTYDTHPALSLSWGIPLGSGFSFEGYSLYIAAKGKDEFGNGTAPEFNFDGQVMYDAGAALGMAKNSFRLGLEYQYWHNKFGNPSSVPGSLAKTPMIRAEYHF